MSSALAIAAVTRTLRNLLFDAASDLGGAEVSAKPPDRARATATGNQINLFLYHTSIDAALRNDDPPGTRPGEPAFPPLPLILHYLITAYGDGDDDVMAHNLLGRAMVALHDHPVLGPREIKIALAGNDLWEQVERIRITPEALSIDDMYRLWTAFQTQYRISAAYQARVVLIESRRQARTPLPVLTRGPADAGVSVVPFVIPPVPTLTAAQPQRRQPAARLGDEVTLSGVHLSGASAIRFLPGRFDDLLDTLPGVLLSVTDSEIRFVVPDRPDQLAAGMYTVAAVFPPPAGAAPGTPEHLSNEVPLAIAPLVTAGLPANLGRNPDGSVIVDLSCSPRVRTGQRVVLLFGDRPVQPDGFAPPTAVLRFVVPAAEPGRYLLRLRVDGIDSEFIDRTVRPPVFDPSQSVVVT